MWSVEAPSAWAAVRLKNGNTLISGNQHGYVREVNRRARSSGSSRRTTCPGFRSTRCRKCRASPTATRLINNWVGSVPQQDWPTVVQLIEVTRDKKVVWALRDWTTLGPASSTQLLDEPGAAEKGQLQR